MPRLEFINEEDNEISELDFELDGFHQQKVLRGTEAYARNLDRLIRMRKRSNPSDPDMGIDILSYRFKDIDQNAGGILEDDIRNQANKYIRNNPIETIEISTAKYNGAYILYIKVKLFRTKEDVTIGYYQKNGNVISTKIVIERPKNINTKGTRLNR